MCKVMSQKTVYRYVLAVLGYRNVYEDVFKKSIDVQWFAIPDFFLPVHNLLTSRRKYWKYHRNSVDSQSNRGFTLRTYSSIESLYAFLEAGNFF